MNGSIEERYYAVHSASFARPIRTFGLSVEDAPFKHRDLSIFQTRAKGKIDLFSEHLLVTLYIQMYTIRGFALQSGTPLALLVRPDSPGYRRWPSYAQKRERDLRKRAYKNLSPLSPSEENGVVDVKPTRREV
jgi:hypothetical protein